MDDVTEQVDELVGSFLNGNCGHVVDTILAEELLVRKIQLVARVAVSLEDEDRERFINIIESRLEE